MGQKLTDGRVTTLDDPYSGEWLPLPISKEEITKIQNQESIPIEFWSVLQYGSAPCCFRTSINGDGKSSKLGR